MIKQERLATATQVIIIDVDLGTPASVSEVARTSKTARVCWLARRGSVFTTRSSIRHHRHCFRARPLSRTSEPWWTRTLLAGALARPLLTAESVSRRRGSFEPRTLAVFDDYRNRIGKSRRRKDIEIHPEGG